jgi:hypothetical protein
MNNYSQCTLSNILPFNLGQTKFDITKILNSSNSIGKWTDLYSNNQYDNGWKKYDYLKNDSIYQTVIRLNHQQDNCFNGYENIVYLSLADDKLYEISMVQKYSKERYTEMMVDFNNYIDIFTKIYPYNNSFTMSTSDTNEKIGEGVRFYKDPIEKRNRVKIEEVRVSYAIKYKSIYNTDAKKFISTSEIESCNIEIETVNLKGTKLTSQRF